jgi:2,3-dimethylmalate lyase
MKKKSTRLRELLKSGELVFTIQVGTAHQAQLAEKAGFELVGISGSSTSVQIFGLPDAGFVTMTELVENVERICHAVNIPVTVDCDTGFGNAINVRRTVESVIRAGAAGFFIEDQVAPKRCGFVKGKEVVSLEEAVGKYRAAIDVRDELDPDVIVMARTDVRGAAGGSVDEVIRRGRAYLDAGVDIFYAEALQSRDEIRQVRNALKGCLLRVTTNAIKPPLTQEEYKELGLCLPSTHISNVATIAMYDFLLDFKKRGIAAHEEFKQRTKDHPMGNFGIFDLTGFPRVAEWETKYLSAEKLQHYDNSLGIYDPRKGKG